MMTRDFLSLSLFFASRPKNKDERERARKKAAFRDAQRCFKEQRFSLSLSCYVYINLKRKPPFCFGETSSDICLFQMCLSDVCIEKKNETKERASAARDARENGGDEWPRGERTRRGEKNTATERTTGFVDGVV